MKRASVNSKYQSTFLPVFQDAETRIKTLILMAFLFMWGEYVLRLRVSKIIKDTELKIGDIPNRQAYMAGLIATSNAMILNSYRKPHLEFLAKKEELKLKTPGEAFSIAHAKASPNVKDYAKELRRYRKELAERPIVTLETGKHSISLWQKAELDVRYEHQLSMIEDLKAQGIDLCYISSHPDCSKRCEPWQGKLVSLTKHSRMSGFRVGKVDGKWVYSLPDITSQRDKYGYNNNVIVGFNCRHKLIAYKGQLPPTKFSKEDVHDQRKIETRIRAMERDIRKIKERAYLAEKSKDNQDAAFLKKKAKYMVEKYKRFCTGNGYAWENYRIQINYAESV